MKQKDVKVGDKFERLEVLEIIKEKYKPTKVKCKCLNDDNIKIVDLASLVKGRTRSCGCLSFETKSKLTIERNTKHGLSKHQLFNIWGKMISRCYNKNADNYDFYGGRGITICDEWHYDFKKFYDWAIVNGWQKDLTIDRMDNASIYEPNNCRWTTQIEQANNKRNNHLVKAFGEIKTIANWVRDSRCKVSYSTLLSRISYYGWNSEEALSTFAHHVNK